jgi:branched-chain amino acid transport system ATP-binding protein
MTATMLAPQVAAIATPTLELVDVRAAYGAVPVLHGISLTVAPGAVVALLGANGAGKTTTLRVASGLLPASSGTVRYMGIDVRRASPADLVRRGMVHVPEGRRIFGDFTVDENLLIAAHTERDRKAINDRRERVFELLPVLGKRHRQRAGTLSGGEQQMLAIGRALMVDAKLLLLDEPSLGLAPTIVESIFAVLSRLNRDLGLTILLVEQNAVVALEISQWAYVLEVGEVAREGASAGLFAQDEALRRAYLG